jgi:hypothetical protein
VGGYTVDRLKKGKISNPIAGVPRDILLEQIALFCTTHQLQEHTEVIQRGALIAQDPDNWDTQVTDLSETERRELQMEVDHKWRQPWQLYFTILLCSIGACVQGWDQTGSNGANLSFRQQFGIEIIPGTPDYERNNWLVGLVNSAPYLTAGTISPLLADPLNHIVGCRGAIFAAAVFCVAAPIRSGFTKSLTQLLACRLPLGFGISFKEITSPGVCC